MGGATFPINIFWHLCSGEETRGFWLVMMGGNDERADPHWLGKYGEVGGANW